ncbi:GNAT family N-acetyltransferase [Salinirussus salinus]|jgi:ribosomal protein S18 acetylase RimI-like enzyme|uniref:GNAT family N-acetyltransferase n=1 Tax=Salinirussus salinus TaxID=1198300 RepID=UPI00135B22F4|nr:GNAT family N-acetyltransferase [Salinirussus salinus]
MELTETLEFDHDDREDIYEYIESHGASRPKQVRKSLNMGERAFGHHAAILKRDGVLEEADGRLRIAFEAGTEEEFEAEDVEFAIRQAREEDLTGLVGAIRQAIGGGAYVDAETVADVVDSEGVLLRHNELESRIFFVATVDGEVVGWVHLKHPESAKLAHTAELTVGVLEEYRGNSIGSHLLERGLEWGQSQGFERIYNSIPSTNEDAIEFLEGRGWEVEAVREGHYKLDGEYIDEVMMAREL